MSRKSKCNDISDDERKRQMMWQLWECLWTTMMDRLKDPDVVRGSTMATIVEFLRLNGTYLDAAAHGRKDMQTTQAQLEELYKGLPFVD
jgi:hypothetical protein